MKRFKKNQNNKGCQRYIEFVMTRGRTDSAITLISFVITIVVLLILAGVTIATLTRRKPEF